MAPILKDPKPALSALAALMFFSLLLYESQNQNIGFHHFSVGKGSQHFLTACFDNVSSIADQLTLYSHLLGIQALNPRLDGVVLPYNGTIRSAFYLKVDDDIAQARSELNTDYFCQEYKKNYLIKHFYNTDVGHFYFIPWSFLPGTHYVLEDDMSHVEEKLRDHLIFQASVGERVRDYFQRKKISENVTVIGCDIMRSGAPLGVKKTKKHQIVYMQYLAKAVEFYNSKFEGRNVTYIVHTDDKAWMQQVLKNVPNVIYLNSVDDIFNLAVLSHCNHSIITGSGFGWWAAWLANGNTVYFNDWPVPDSHGNKSVYNPVDWIPL